MWLDRFERGKNNFGVLSPFAPRKQRHFRGAKGDIILPVFLSASPALASTFTKKRTTRPGKPADSPYFIRFSSIPRRLQIFRRLRDCASSSRIKGISTTFSRSSANGCFPSMTFRLRLWPKKYWQTLRKSAI